MSNWYLVSFPSRFFEGGICTANFKTKKRGGQVVRTGSKRKINGRNRQHD